LHLPFFAVRETACGHSDHSRQCNTSVAFRAERTLTAPHSHYWRTALATCAVHIDLSAIALPFFLLALAQPHARPAAVLVDERDARS